MCVPAGIYCKYRIVFLLKDLAHKGLHVVYNLATGHVLGGWDYWKRITHKCAILHYWDHLKQYIFVIYINKYIRYSSNTE